jgi:hypothetical protein
MGAAVAVSIPDGSITAADLDPSVLLPYALVDGSKPFTGQVTMQADAVVRDALSFGQQGTALAPDVTLTRTAAGALRVDTQLGVGAAPGAGVPFVVGTRLSVGSTGTLTLTPDAGANALAAQGPLLVTGQSRHTGASAGVVLEDRTAPGDAGAYQWYATGTELHLYRTASSELFLFGTDRFVPATDNSRYLGDGGRKWIQLYAQNGTIATSSAAVKEGITPLDPVACYQAAKAVRWYEFTYLPPAYQEPSGADDEDAGVRDARLDESRSAYARSLAETAHTRHQRGFVYPADAEAKDELGGPLPPVPDLFGLADRESTTPQADLATLGCALQHVIARLEALEAPAA